ncbi:hypothetical protein QU670_01880 [Actinomyces massiliensis]|uniref:LppM domain-containing protein n=1 Tax=Actinomyces massiliensis F0489 TaxID=1125718 RepID=J1HNX6_9ACTO|nr:hypothetical protein [Actinomyces massiliensis]EJF47293.1 hypothetical protein HMPREF1318_1575 [Actinomyces massiliensis F0489]WLD72029.1 hypothetical protein QU670_01880 [Actinomyces massiliensis]
MRPPLLTSLHRLAAVTTLAMVAIGAVGFSPAARAKTPSQTSYTVSIEVTKSSIVNAHGTAEADYMDSSYCDADLIATNFDSSVDVQADLDSANKVCTFSITNMSITQFNDYFNGNIEHDNGSFTYTSDPFAYDSVEVSVTFPGKVSRVSGDGTRSGNTATWKHVERETGSLEATGKDSPGLPWLWITIGVIAVILVGGGIILAIALTTRQKKRQLEPFGTGTVGPYSHPQMHPQMPQPGYAQPAHPGFPQPGVQGPPQPGPQQPGYTQPGAPQQPGPPNQPWPGQQSSPGAPY